MRGNYIKISYIYIYNTRPAELVDHARERPVKVKPMIALERTSASNSIKYERSIDIRVYICVSFFSLPPEMNARFVGGKWKKQRASGAESRFGYEVRARDRRFHAGLDAYADFSI